MKKLMLLVAVAMLAGCGSGDSSNGDIVSNWILAESDAGVFVGASHDDTAGWLATTSKGVFATYTSVETPRGAGVKFYRYTVRATGEEVSKFLISESKVSNVREVITFTP